MKQIVKVSLIVLSLVAAKSYASTQEFWNWDFHRGCWNCVGTAQGLVDTCYRSWYGCDHVPQGMVGIKSLKVSRTRVSLFSEQWPSLGSIVNVVTRLPSFESICDYRAKTTITLPNGYVYRDYSEQHNGCSYGIANRWMWGVEANYPADSVVRGYWKDQKTDHRYRYVGKTGI